MTETRLRHSRKAFSLVEIIIAAGISIIFFSGLVYLATTTRAETSKAGNYLRALQIAQETIELLQAMSSDSLRGNNIQIFEGSLVNPHNGKMITIPVNHQSPWKPETQNYPEQYENAWFYRRIRIDKVTGGSAARFLKNLHVDVYWNEGKKPEKIESLGSEPDRMRKLTLSTLIFDENETY